MPLVVEKDTECRLGDAGLDVLDGDTDADTIGGEPGGVSRGVLVCDANKRPGDIRGLEAKIIQKQKQNKIKKFDVYQCSGKLLLLCNQLQHSYPSLMICNWLNQKILTTTESYKRPKFIKITS